jgi:hypothetical protein
MFSPSGHRFRQIRLRTKVCPAVPQHGQNATGDVAETDGKVAVLVLL